MTGCLPPATLSRMGLAPFVAQLRPYDGAFLFARGGAAGGIGDRLDSWGQTAAENRRVLERLREALLR